MERKKNTNVIALTDFSAIGISAVRHAATLALFFESSLTIYTHFSLEKNAVFRQKNADFDQLLAEFQNRLSIRVDDTPYQLKAMHALAESANNIMFIIGVGRKKNDTYFTVGKALKFIAPSRLPVMTVGVQPPRDEKWQNVLLPIEIDRAIKEKSLWAGYFNRFGQSAIHILHNVYQDRISKDKLDDSLAFVEKLYKNLEINPVEHEITPRADDLDAYALQHAADYEASLLVIMTTTHKTWIDVLFGTRERSFIANAESLPVLCINERDDLFVLCT
ncbi:MAG: hypothetical protein MJZ70_05745 [Bacteroidales bacterium]|nr:hypothetical protein [Bacteroidales bacterium]